MRILMIYAFMIFLRHAAFSMIIPSQELVIWLSNTAKKFVKVRLQSIWVNFSYANCILKALNTSASKMVTNATVVIVHRNSYQLYPLIVTNNAVAINLNFAEVVGVWTFFKVIGTRQLLLLLQLFWFWVLTDLQMFPCSSVSKVSQDCKHVGRMRAEKIQIAAS